MGTFTIKSSDLKVEFKETRESYDQVPNLTAYCTQFPESFNVQIRGTVPLYNDNNHFKKDVKKRNLIATIHLTREEIRSLVEFVNNEEKR